MPFISSICFFLGSMINIGRIIHIVKLVKAKRRLDVFFELLMLIILQFMPVFIVPFLFEKEMDEFGIVLLLIVCFFTGITWSNMCASLFRELEYKVTIIGYEVRNEATPSLITFVIEIKQFFMGIFNRLFLYGYVFKQGNLHPNTQGWLQVKFNTLVHNARLNNVKLYMFESKDDMGFALLKPIFRKKPNCVCLSTYWCGKLTPKELNALIAHELMHIRHWDRGSVQFLRSLLTIQCIVFGMVGFAYLIDVVNNFAPILGFILLFVFLIMLIPYFIIFAYFLFNKHGYWKQVSEIKADRRACQIEGVTLEGLIALLRRLHALEEKDFREKKWFEKLSYRYNNWHTHPSVEYRIHLIENYRRWSMMDYVFLFMKTIRWAVTGKGWNGQ